VCRPRSRPQVETLENRWSPGSVLLGANIGAPWLASVFGDGASGADGPPEHVRPVEPPSVGVNPSAAASVPLASRPDHDLAPSFGDGAAGASDLSDDDLASLARLGPDNQPFNPAPLPLTGGFANPTGGPFVHLNLPGPADATPPNPPTSPQPSTNDPSMITDFDGEVAVAKVQGSGTGTNTVTGATSTLFFEVDLRFVQGTYQAVDGQFHHGTFALV
jgi:hypothetical protein